MPNVNVNIPAESIAILVAAIGAEYPISESDIDPVTEVQYTAVAWAKKKWLADYPRLLIRKYLQKQADAAAPEPDEEPEANSFEDV